MKRLVISIILGARCAGLVMAAGTNDVLIFSFFRDNGQDGMYLASSEDGLHFTALNNDKPVMTPGPWPGQQLVRDPQIIFHDGKFHAAWSTQWDGNGFGYAESKDLVTWSAPVFVKPFPASQPQPKRVWFSWICWDPIQKNFIITWADSWQLYLMRTADWKVFTEPKKLLDQKFGCLDGDMVLDNEKKRWIMTIKNEEEEAKGGKNLMVASCPSDFSEPWSLDPRPIIGPGTSIHPGTMTEGGCLLKQKDGWYLYWDEPLAQPTCAYGLASSADLKTWTDRSAELQMPKDRRHGNISRVPRTAVGWLKRALPTNTSENGAGKKLENANLTARNSSPRLKLVVVKTLPYPVINSRTPGAEEIPGGFEGGNTVKVIVRGRSEYHLFAHSYETLDWSHCRMDHWVSADGLHWCHDKVLVPPYTDKVTGLWTLSCSPMPFFDTKADRWQIYYALFAKPQQNWSSGGTLRCASSKVKGRDGISGPYDFPGEEVIKPGVGYPKTACVNSVSTPFLAKDGKWLVFYGGDNFSALLPDTKTWGKWWVALASAPSPRGPYTQLGNEPQPLIAPTGFNENPMPIRIRGPKSGKDYWVATFDFLHDEVAGPNLSEIGFTWSSDGRDWPAEHGQAVDIRAGFNAGEKPWWHVIRTPHDLIDEGDGMFTCFFTATSEDDHGFRGIGMVKFKIEEVTDGFAK